MHRQFFPILIQAPEEKQRHRAPENRPDRDKPVGVVVARVEVLHHVGVVILYAVGIGLMCFKVKEGEYPPPLPTVDGGKELISQAKTYFVECNSQPYFWNFFCSDLLHCYIVTLTLNGLSLHKTK